MCERERERGNVCMRERERERGGGNVCMRERERERERERQCVYERERESACVRARAFFASVERPCCVNMPTQKIP